MLEFFHNFITNQDTFLGVVYFAAILVFAIVSVKITGKDE